jgi:hypothetical protein
MGCPDRQCRQEVGFYAEINPMTFGKWRIDWTDGVVIENNW